SRPSEAFLDWGWRIPFLFSAVLVIVRPWIRLNLGESTAFSKAAETRRVVKLPLGEGVRRHRRRLTPGTFSMPATPRLCPLLATYVLFYLMTTFSLSYGRAPVEPGPGQLPGLGYSYNDFVLMLIFGVVFFGIFTLISGPLADRWGRRKTLIMVTLGIIAFAL